MVYQKKKKEKIMVKERLTRVEFMEDHVGVGGIWKVGGTRMIWSQLEMERGIVAFVGLLAALYVK